MAGTPETGLSFHPYLPSPEAAGRNPKAIYSDHMPIFARVPINGTDKVLNVLSYNTLTPQSTLASGFGSELWPQIDGDCVNGNPPLRTSRVLDAILAMVTKHDVDVVYLQESWQELIDALLGHKSLCEEWRLHRKHRRVDTQRFTCTGIVTLTRIATVGLPEARQFTPTHPEYKDSFELLEAKIPDTDRTIQLANAHLRHSDTPFAAEALIGELFYRAVSERMQLVFGGDFNNRMIAPNKEIPFNNVVPSYFYDGQVVDSTDAILTCNEQDQVRILPNDSLNPATAEKIDTEVAEYVKTNFSMMPAFQQAIMKNPRITLNIDRDLQDQPGPDSPLARAGFRFRVAVNALGEKYLGLCAEFPPRSWVNDQYRARVAVFQKVASALQNIPGISLRYNADEQTDPLIVFKSLKIGPGQDIKAAISKLGLTNEQSLDEQLNTIKDCMFKQETNIAQQKVFAFIKIYKAMRDGQSGLKNKDFTLSFAGKSSSEITTMIEAHAARENTRTHKAWQLAELHCGMNSVPWCKDEVLFTEVYKYAYERSGIFKQSRFLSFGQRASSLGEKMKGVSMETIENVSEKTRTGKIRLALRS